VKNLPETLIKDEDLKNFFSKFGPVKNAKVFVQETGDKDPIGNPILKGKGFGFVCFETQISAALVQAKKPTDLVLDDHPLEVFFFKSKDELEKENNKKREQLAKADNKEGGIQELFK
jgi:RNA recognition motif-containing protein